MEYLVAWYISVLISSLITVLYISRVRNRRVLAPDVHKPYRVEIPKIGGVCLITSSVVSVILDYVLKALPITLLLVVQIPAIIVGIIGLIDDLFDTRPILRVLVSVFTASLLVVLVKPVNYFLIVGPIKNVIFLEVLSCILMVIMFNAVNMLDVMNGIVSGGLLIVFTALCIVCIIRGLYKYSLIYLLLVCQTIPLFLFNKYPAKVFLGNVGSYILGTYVGVTACYCGTFVETLLSCLPFIINGLLILVSTRGRAFAGGRKKLARPIVCNGGLLKPNLDRDATLTLARIFVIYGCNTEYKVVKNILLMFLLSSILTIVVVSIFR